MKKLFFTPSRNLHSVPVAALASLAILNATTACSDDDSEGDEVLNEKTVVTNDAEANALAYSAYTAWGRYSSGYSFTLESVSSTTISFEGEESAEGPKISRLDYDLDNYYFSYPWLRNQAAIAAANDAIATIPNASGVSDEVKKVTVARAKLVRALAHSVLVQIFGEIPLNLEVGSENKVRQDIDEVYAQIVKDLEEAAEGLPDNSGSTINPSKAAAWALLSRVYLAWGNNPLTYEQVQAIASSKVDPSPSYNKDRLRKSVEYADKVINSGLFSLESDFADIWGTGNEDRSKEHILTFKRDGDSEGTGNHQTHCSFTFAFNLYQDNHIGPSNYNVWEDWKAEDPTDVRREWSYTSQLVNEDDNKTYYFLPPVTLPRFGKYIDRTYANGPNICITKNDLDRIEYRYAEVLLNKAEALVELGENNAEATALVNKLTARAKSNKTYTAVTLDDIKDQWSKEFTYEQRNWYNQTRWKTLIADVQKVATFEHFKEKYNDANGTGYELDADGNSKDYYGEETVAGNNAFFLKVYKHLHAKYDNIAGKYYRYPIPHDSEGGSLGIVPQNPGFENL